MKAARRTKRDAPWTKAGVLLAAGMLLMAGCSTAPPVRGGGDARPAGPGPGAGTQRAAAGGQSEVVAFEGAGFSGLSAAPPRVSAAAYIVVNPRNGQILLEHNAYVRRPVASTQKLLTALVVLDGGNLEETVIVAGSDTWVEPTVMGIKAGERYRKRDLLEAMVVRSSNDIAACLARSHAGSEARFAAMMNAKAQSLGMRNSHFVNPHGLNAAGQYSTAFDLAILATHVMSNSYLHGLTQYQEMTFRYADGRTRQIMNTNKVLRMSSYCTGMKTGYTSPAGRCLVSAGQRGLKRVIVVVLGSEVPNVWNDSMALIHWGLEVPQPLASNP